MLLGQASGVKYRFRLTLWREGDPTLSEAHFRTDGARPVDWGASVFGLSESCVKVVVSDADEFQRPRQGAHGSFLGVSGDLSLWILGKA